MHFALRKKRPLFSGLFYDLSLKKDADIGLVGIFLFPKTNYLELRYIREKTKVLFFVLSYITIFV